ncbi:MAG: hypothetical protein RLZZ396_780, partial [Planctomycetota bacterium]
LGYNARYFKDERNDAPVRQETDHQ